jgi:hypothetical protein
VLFRSTQAGVTDAGALADAWLVSDTLAAWVPPCPRSTPAAVAWPACAAAAALEALHPAAVAAAVAAAIAGLPPAFTPPATPPPPPLDAVIAVHAVHGTAIARLLKHV